MGVGNPEIALEWDEPDASCGCCGFPESSPRDSQGSRSHGCKDNLGMLADVSLVMKII